MLPIPAPIKTVITIVVAVICLIFLLETLFGGGSLGLHSLSFR